MVKKLTLDVQDENLWADVHRYKVANKLPNLSRAIEELVRKGLKTEKK